VSRVINPDSAGKQRNQLSRAIAVAVRELARQTDTGVDAHDLAAFIAAALKSIADGIELSVAAWEKRGYWVKADRFRLEWDWAGPISEKMQKAVLEDDWGAIANLSAQIAQKLNKVQISDNHRLGKPWSNALERLKAGIK
jgi:hypothetical protein